MPPPVFRLGAVAVLVAATGAIGLAQSDVAYTQSETLAVGEARATIMLTGNDQHRQYRLTTNAELRDNQPADQRLLFAELPGRPSLRTGSPLFDGLYALAITEAQQNSVNQIQDGGYNHGQPIELCAFQTGAKWSYVWTRDLAYSVDLALAQFDPPRAASSLMFKASQAKAAVTLAAKYQLVQDTGSGGSYPISTDRVVWALGAVKLLQHLPSAAQYEFAQRIYPYLCGTIKQDRQLIFDPGDGLYRGEQSFLDWREQTYPLWTRDNVLAIGWSKALSTNVGHYDILKTTAELAEKLGHDADQQRFTRWATALKAAINERFYDHEANLYSAYLLSDGAWSIPVRRYDLLGQALAILTGVADPQRAQAIIASYPTGPHGPSVVWPHDPDVPIYHNHAIWPFVTAYWLKAARQADNAAAVTHGVRSLMQPASLNLSNMENLDFVTGKVWAKNGDIEGPVINSQRQLWSVAGYLSMVQDVIFGMQTHWDAIRFRPYITCGLRNSVFESSATLDLNDLRYREKRIDVRVHLPAESFAEEGAYAIERVTLNGHDIGAAFVSVDALLPRNRFEVYLGAGQAADPHALRLITEFDNPQAHFGPAMPQWRNGDAGGITTDGRLLTLHYVCNDPNVSFTIYRNGRVQARGIRATTWTDPDSADFADQTYGYAVAAVYDVGGNASHLSETRCYVAPGNHFVIPADKLHHVGGDLFEEHHWQNWGQLGHSLTAEHCQTPRDGRYMLRVSFANGSGPISTGITCAVKRVQVVEEQSDRVVADSYVIMPQSNDWTRFDLSSPVFALLEANHSYTVRLFEDGYAHNMSYLEHNRRYTANVGGGDAPYNYVNVAGFELTYLSNLADAASSLLESRTAEVNADRGDD